MAVPGLLRNVTVRFTALMGGFVGPISAAGGALNSLSRTVDQSTGRQRQAFNNLGQTATVFGGALAIGFGMAVKAAADFDKAMSKVAAVSDATGEQLNQLREAALKAGKDTAFSATQAAEAESELAKAGIETADILGGALKGSLDLAAAGQLSLEEAATVSAQAMNIFNLKGKDVGHIADVLAAGANKSAADVKGLAWSLRMGGQVAAQTGLSLEDTVGTLSMFADQALIGSDAGTSLKVMLQMLAAPSDKSRELMEELGLEVYNTSGEFVGMEKLAESMQKTMGDLTQEQRDYAMAQIFGSDAVRAANILYKQGAAGVREYTKAVDDNGAATRTAEKLMDNLAGDLEKLKGSLETALIQSGSGANVVLREMVQILDAVLSGYLALPRGVQSGIVVLIGVAGAAILVTKGLMFMIGTVRDARLALQALGITSARVSGWMATMRGALMSTATFMTGPWGIALAAGAAAITFWYMKKQKAKEVTEEFTSAIEADSGALGENTREAVANRLEKDGLLKIAQKLGIDTKLMTDAVMGNTDAQAQLNAELDKFGSSSGDRITGLSNMTDEEMQNATAAEILKNKLKDQTGALREATESTKRKTEATEESTASHETIGDVLDSTTFKTDNLTESEQKLVDVMRNAKSSSDDLEDAFRNLAIGALEVDKAMIRQRESTEAAIKASDKKKGINDDELMALIGIAENGHKVLVSMKANEAGSEALFKEQQKLAASFIKTAMAMGASKQEATEMARRYGLFTKEVLEGTDALDPFVTALNRTAARLDDMRTSLGGGQKAHQAMRAELEKQLPVLYALAGNNQKARAQVDQLAKAMGFAGRQTDVSRDKFMEAAKSMDISADRARELWKALSQLKDKDVDVQVDAQGNYRLPTGKPIPYYKGGHVPYLGPGTSRNYDSVPAVLRVDEHVVTPEEVDAVGGHGAMYRLRAAMLRGELKGYASGGKVGKGSLNSGSVNFSSAGDTRSKVRTVVEPINVGYTAMITYMAKQMAEAYAKAIAESGGGVVQAARSQIGLPYSWGGGGTGGPSYGIGRGAGTYGFDCSGLTQYAWWQGRKLDIGGVTWDQIAASSTIGSPRPGALGFPHAGHVVLYSGNGKVIQAPYTGARVYEGPSSRNYNWRWPNAAKYADGGAVTWEDRRLGQRYVQSGAVTDRVRETAFLELAGDPGPIKGYATGGRVTGRRGRDNLLLRATAGEFVVDPETTSRYEPLLAAMTSRSMGAGLTTSRVGVSSGSSSGGSGALHVHVHNHGVLGDQMQVESWLVGAMDGLRRRGRLPSSN